MTDRTTWTRLEPRPRSDEMRDGLRAEIRDPLWMLTRQWQVSEFRGEDAGSPVRADLTIAEDDLDRVDLRGGGHGEVGPFDYDGGPLETTVEREAVMTDDDGPPLRLRAEAGQQYLRTLVDLGYGSYTTGDFPETFHLSSPEESLEAPDRRYVEMMAGRALDGTAVARAIASAVDNIDSVVDGEASSWSGVSAGDLPLPTGESRTGTFEDCVESFYGWYVDLYDEPTVETGSAWDPTRLEYRFAVSTGAEETETVFEAEAYQGGRLDWHAFSAAEADESLQDSTDGWNPDSVLDTTEVPPSLDPNNDDALDPTAEHYPPEHPTSLRHKTVMPTQVSFPGMPATRFWEFEDGSADLSQVAADGSSLSRLLLTEFAVQYGNDWFSIPIETPIGTLTRLTDLTVTDSFGVTETATAAMDDDWQLYMHDLPGHSEPGLFVPPTLADLATSDPVEKVVFTRDEVANLAFGIERIFEGPTGRAVDRTEFQPPELVVDSVLAKDDPDEEYVELANPGEDRLVLDGHSIGAVTDDTETSIFTFGQRTLGPGETITLYTGGTADADGVAAGLSASVWSSAEAVAVRDEDDTLVAKKLLARPSDALADYRLSTDVPNYWFPFTAEQSAGAFVLERALLLDSDTLGLPIAQLPRPKGEILRPEDKLLPGDADTYRIFDEEVTRSGREVTRRYQFARWTDGASHLWSSRESRVADTKLTSGLAFDILEERE